MNWNWLLERTVRAVHDEQVAEHGGTQGMLDDRLLSSALARPQNLLAYGQPSAFDLAAAYALGIIQNRSFIDGNKRTGFIAASVFLLINGRQLDVEESEAVSSVLALATGMMGESEFSAWLRDNCRPR